MKSKIDKECNHRFVKTKSWIDNKVLWEQIVCVNCHKILSKPKKGIDNVIQLDTRNLISETKDA